MKTVKTFRATIHVGLRIGYSQTVHLQKDAESVLQEYCNEIGFCVSVTPQSFIYKDGNEPGVAVGIIGYPRFPEESLTLKSRALDIASRLMRSLGQNRVTVVFDDDTFMLELDLGD